MAENGVAHLRVLIANERLDRPELPAQGVVGLGHEVIARQVNVKEVGTVTRESPGWGYKRIVGELLGLGVAVSPSSVRAILIRHGLPPAPERDALSCRRFLRKQAASMIACDFLTVETILLTRIYALFFVSLEPRRIEFVASTTNPDGRWVTQQARNVIMQLGEGDPRDANIAA